MRFKGYRLGYLEDKKETFDAENYVNMIKHIRKIAEEQNYPPAE
jgi:hypothetical protein